MFNIAIGSDSPDVQRTARNALLQMINTVIKRVMQAPLVRALCRAWQRAAVHAAMHCARQSSW